MSDDNKIRILLVDDEQSVRSVLTELLKSFDNILVVGEAASVPEAVREIHKLNPDLLFLDIEMPGYNGLQLLEFFNPLEVTFDIIFVTAFNDYAIQAFKISAFDYLLKPVSSQELKLTLQRYTSSKKNHKLLERIDLLKNTFKQDALPLQIAVNSLQGIDFIQLADIVLLEASGTYTKIVKDDNTGIMASKPIGEFEKLLMNNEQFFRAHRSYIININHVKKLSSKEGDIIVMKNALQIPLSRYRKKDFEKAIEHFRI